MTRLEIESPGAIGHLQEPLSSPSEIKPEESGGSSEFSNKAELEVRAHLSPKSGLKVRVLVVEDDPADVELVLRALRSGGFDPVSDVAQTEADFLDRIRKNSYDAVLADYNLPTWNGMEAVKLLRREGLDIPVVLVSGALGELKAVECIKQGAADYVLKDHLPRLPESVRRALRDQKLRGEHRQAQEELALQP
jgi:DNA-binding NtrC family response regulator